MSRRPYEFDNFVIADGSAAVLDLAVNRRSFPAAEKTPSAETAEVLENVRNRLTGGQSISVGIAIIFPCLLI